MMSMTGGRGHERKRAWEVVPAPFQRPVDASCGKIHAAGDTYPFKAGLCGTSTRGKVRQRYLKTMALTWRKKSTQLARARWES